MAKGPHHVRHRYPHRHPVTASNFNNAAALRGLVGTTVANFPAVNEVSGDKGYLAHSNCDVIEKHGATPFIPFKSNSVTPPPGSP